VDAVLAMMVARDCKKIDGGLPQHIYARMLVNIVIDFVIGLVPFVGDLADAVFKCNSQNAVLLEKYLRDKAAKQDTARLKNEPHQQQRPVDLSIPEQFDRYEDDALADPPGYTADPAAGPSRPPAASHAPENRHNRSWFGGKKQEQGDLETGVIRNP
jgi:hypothetical protein